MQIAILGAGMVGRAMAIDLQQKYSVTSLANANAEDATPGYGVKVFVSTSSTAAGVVAGDQVSINDYTFDYINETPPLLVLNEIKLNRGNAFYKEILEYVTLINKICKNNLVIHCLINLKLKRKKYRIIVISIIIN